MHGIKLCGLLILTAASACYSGRTADGEDQEPIAPPKAKVPTVIAPQVGERLTVSWLPQGDMDGDGFDDLVIQGVSIAESSPNAPITLYLFYGRAEFPPKLSTADADAVFETAPTNSGPIGDVNGDGLADLLLAHEASTEFVFGSSKRLRGSFAGRTAGVIWENGELPPPAAPGLTTQLWVQPAHDIDGDGCDDLLVNATTISEEGGLGTHGFLVPGHRGEWASAIWDPTWAGVSFGTGPIGEGDAARIADIWPQATGDLDDDGHADLLASSGERSLVFYGGREFRDQLSAADADAQLMQPAGSLDPELGSVQSVLSGLFSDIDRDGMDDLVANSEVSDSISFIYGRRWSGELELAQDFTLEVETPGQQSIVAAGIADIDGDDRPEILLSVGSFGSDAAFPSSAQPGLAAVYAVRGTGKRLQGPRKLLASERWIVAEPSPTPGAEQGAAFTLGLGGDVDGDGGQDILTNLPYDVDGISAPVYLIPSTPRVSD